MKLSDFLISAATGGLSEAQMMAYVDPSLLERDASITWLFDNTLNITSLAPYATNASIGLAGFAKDASLALYVPLTGGNVIQTGGLGSYNAGYWRMPNLMATSTVPVFLPNRNSPSTGLGGAQSNLSLIVEGVEKVAIGSNTFVKSPLYVNTSPENNYLIFENNNTPIGYIGSRLPITASDPSDFLFMAYGNNRIGLLTNNTPRVVITGSGNVAIGANQDPLSKLHITQSSLTGYPILGSPSTSTGFFLSGDTNLYGLYAGIETGAGNAWMQVMRNNTATAYNLILQPAGGNVGIANTNPSYPLDVSGNGVIFRRANQFLFFNPNYNFANQFGQIQSGVGISFATGGDNTRMVCTSTGNIGIGTTTPSHRLSVVGDVSISGDLFVLGMNAQTNAKVVFYDTTTGELTYGNPASADISTLGIESYVNSSTYYDGSIMYRTMPNPSTGLSSQASQGVYITLTSGTNFVAGNPAYLDLSGKAYITTVNSSNNFPSFGIAVESFSAGPARFLINGIYRDTAYNFAVGRQVYVGSGGTLTTTRPTTAGDCVQVMGIATSPDSLIVNPSPDFIVLK